DVLDGLLGGHDTAHVPGDAGAPGEYPWRYRVRQPPEVRLALNRGQHLLVSSVDPVIPERYLVGCERLTEREKASANISAVLERLANPQLHRHRLRRLKQTTRVLAHV